jgi:taurine dioxygenase
MSFETISVTPTTPRIGANVEGISLAEPLTNRQVDDLHRALAEHQVLFFRNQLLDEESQRGWAGTSASCTSIPIRPGQQGIPRYCRSTPTPIPSA